MEEFEKVIIDLHARDATHFHTCVRWKNFGLKALNRQEVAGSCKPGSKLIDGIIGGRQEKKIGGCESKAASEGDS